jgi:hypothetical protein
MELDVQILFINGLPRAGKDKLVEFVTGIGKTCAINVGSISSVDPVYNMFEAAGISGDAKTPEWRAAMSEVGDALETHLSYRSTWCVKQARFADMRGNHVFFIHMREPDLISKTSALLAADGYSVRKIFLESKRAEHVQSNKSDTGVWRDDFYDQVLFNDGSLAELRQTAVDLLKKLKPGLTGSLS